MEKDKKPKQETGPSPNASAKGSSESADTSVWVLLPGATWVSSISEEKAQIKAETHMTHIYFFAKLKELQAD